MHLLKKGITVQEYEQICNKYYKMKKKEDQRKISHYNQCRFNADERNFDEVLSKLR